MYGLSGSMHAQYINYLIVVLHFRMYVTELMCIKVEMALKYNAGRERLN